MGLTQIEMEMEVEDLSAPGRKLLEEEVVLEISGQRLNMTLEQTRILQHIDDLTSKVLIAQAPAGTGKTFILSLYVIQLLGK